MLADVAAQKGGSISKSKQAGQRVKRLLEDIATVSAETESVKNRSAVCDEKIRALNQAIHLLSPPTASSSRSASQHRGVPIDCKISAELWMHSSLGYPHCPCITVTLANNSDYDLDGSHWSCM